MGLPVQVVEGKSREQPWGKEFVDIVRVEVIDWMARISIMLMILSAATTATILATEGGEEWVVVSYLSPSRSRTAVPC